MDTEAAVEHLARAVEISESRFRRWSIPRPISFWISGAVAFLAFAANAAAPPRSPRPCTVCGVSPTPSARPAMPIPRPDRAPCHRVSHRRGAPERSDSEVSAPP